MPSAFGHPLPVSVQAGLLLLLFTVQFHSAQYLILQAVAALHRVASAVKLFGVFPYPDTGEIS